jgi:hypothetical protein
MLLSGDSMKLLLLLIFIPTLSQAMVPPLACENEVVDPSKSNRDQLQSYYCELNLRCTVNALNQVSINWDVVDARRAYSMKNQCNDELKLAALMNEINKDPPEIHVKVDPKINQSERSAGKDVPSRGGERAEPNSSVLRQ